MSMVPNRYTSSEARNNCHQDGGGIFFFFLSLYLLHQETFKEIHLQTLVIYALSKVNNYH